MGIVDSIGSFVKHKKDAYIAGLPSGMNRSFGGFAKSMLGTQSLRGIGSQMKLAAQDVRAGFNAGRAGLPAPAGTSKLGGALLSHFGASDMSRFGWGTRGAAIGTRALAAYGALKVANWLNPFSD